MTSKPAGEAPFQRTFMDAVRITDRDDCHGAIIVFGAPHGTPYPGRADDVAYDLETGSATAPAAIRAAANQSSLNIDHYDFDLGGPLLGSTGAQGNTWRLCDRGDMPTTAADGAANRALIQAATANIAQQGGCPVLLGGDDSVPIPFFRGLADIHDRFHVVQLDAHIDWRESIGGEPDGYSSTMRRVSELPASASITQIGMRGVGSARTEEVEAARRWGARLITVKDLRQRGPADIIGAIPQDAPVIITLDCDVFDPGMVPAVNAPSPGGLAFHEIADLIAAVAQNHAIAGFSIVELKPEIDFTGVSALFAARAVLNVIGRVARQPLLAPAAGMER